MKLFNLEKNKLQLFIITLFIFKFYCLFLNPVDAGSISYSGQTFIFYNTLSFNQVAQSFQDWNHPGTPIYYLTYLTSFFWLNDNVNQFQNFIYLNHFIQFFIYLFSFIFFIKYFKFYLEEKEILIFFFFLFSFHQSLQTLEIIDPTNFLIPLSLISTVFLFKTFFSKEYKYLYVNSFILGLCLSTKLTFIPFFISAYFTIFFKFIKNDKFFFKKFFIFNILIIFSLILFNLPILGRMPKIFFSVFFIRDDTHFNLLNIFSIFKDIYTFLKYKNFILLLSLCFLTLVFFLLIIKKFLQKKKDKVDLYFIFYTWLFISFIYILLSSNVEFKEFLSHRPSALFRHLFFYSIFVIPLFFILKNDFFCQFYKKYFNIFFYFFLLLFLFSFSSYIFERDQQIKDLKYRKILLTQALDNMNIDKSKLAFYGDNGYFYADEFMHFYANSTFAGEKYNSQLFQKFSSFKYFRVVDFKYYAYNINSNDSFSTYKSWYNSWDKILKEKLNNKLYLILSHNSLKETSHFPGNRKLEFFINPSNSKIKYILLYGPELKIKENNYNDKDYIYKLSKYLNVKNVKIINLGNDAWYLITLNKEI